MNLTTKRLKRLIKETIQDTMTEQPSKEKLMDQIKDVLRANPKLASKIAKMDRSKLEDRFEAAKEKAEQINEGFFSRTAKGLKYMAKHGLGEFEIAEPIAYLSPLAAGVGGGIASLLNLLAGAHTSPTTWAATMAALMAASITAGEIGDAAEIVEAEEEMSKYKQSKVKK